MFHRNICLFLNTVTSMRSARIPSDLSLVRIVSFTTCSISRQELSKAGAVCTLPTHIGQGHYTASIRCYSSPSDKSTNSGASNGRVKDAWKFVVSVVKSFMQGTRHLWSDVKKVRSIQKKMGELHIRSVAPSSSSLPASITAEELQLVYWVSIIMCIVYNTQ